MKFSTALACAVIVSVGASSPAWSKVVCNVASSKWQPQSALAQKLESQGWKIRKLKVDSGCYEVYGTDGSGKARETHFNPATFEIVGEGHKD